MKAKTLYGYRYSYGDGTLYWDCYLTGKGFIGRVHSITQLSIIATDRGATWKEVL